MDVMQKLAVLTDSAKYDVACTSSGVARSSGGSGLGNSQQCGICHTFAADGRCVSLLKVLLSNVCVYNCKYCVNRASNDVPRASFTPRELADLTIQFYRRNYIEGLFVSSAVVKSPDFTTEQMIKTLEILRYEYQFRGYIHAKAIPGADSALLAKLGVLADRLSVNIELPSEASLRTLAPQKSKNSILRPMQFVSRQAAASAQELQLYRHAPRFAPAGQSTQMIIGATPETDFHILKLSEGLYRKYSLKRVFYSAYIPVVQDTLLPAVDTKPPLLREHRLYQADWLLRYYRFTADEILDENNQNFNPYLDPKCNWAIHNMHLFPVDINRVDYAMLLRVPGIGVRSAKRICTARRSGALDMDDLRRIGVVLKRAQYFIVCRGYARGAHATRSATVRALLDPKAFGVGAEQLSMFAAPALQRLADGGADPRRAARQLQEETVSCLSAEM